MLLKVVGGARFKWWSTRN